MRRTSILTLLVVMIMAIAAPVSATSARATSVRFPEVIDLPGGFFPEGITTGRGSTVYVGSLSDGAIWKGNLRTGEGDVFVEGVAGRIAVGMAYDRRSGQLLVAGGPDGNAYVYDGKSGDLVEMIDLVPSGFVNDVIVTRRAAYFTDSFAPQIYEVPLDRRGAIAGDPRTIPLTGDFQFSPGDFNANGIEATRDGKILIVVNSTFGEIYTVNPQTGVADAIDLGGDIVNGDGLVLIGRTLYAVEGGKNQITEIRLSRDLAEGRVVDALTSEAFDVPTTATRFGRSLYAVNAKFGTPPLPTTPYEIVRVRR